jgi:hypothetical protein
MTETRRRRRGRRRGGGRRFFVIALILIGDAILRLKQNDKESNKKGIRMENVIQRRKSEERKRKERKGKKNVQIRRWLQTRRHRDCQSMKKKTLKWKKQRKQKKKKRRRNTFCRESHSEGEKRGKVGSHLRYRPNKA